MTTTALERARRALAILEQQAAGFGALHIPVHLQIELEEKRREVAELEARERSAGVESSTRVSESGGPQTTIAGDVHGPVLSGQFSGPVTVVTASAPEPATGAGNGRPVVDTAALRARLQRLDDVALETLCMDHFPAVYDAFSRGLRRDEKINLLLDHCRRNPPEAARLAALLP